MMMSNLEFLKKKLIDDIKFINRAILDIYPITDYFYCLNYNSNNHSYNHVPPEAKTFAEKIVQSGTESILELYNQFVLVELISKNSLLIDSQPLPKNIKHLYSKDYQRIINSIITKSDKLSYYCSFTDEFLKDLGICKRNIIPAGAQKINLYSVPKRFIVQDGFKQFMKGISFALIKLGGFNRIYEMHTHSHDPNLMAEFCPEGWEHFYLNVAELLESDKLIRGIYGVSWFFDPQLAEVSPRLTYLQQFPVENGAQLFKIGISAKAIDFATATSKTRKQLYDEGKYIPKDYMLIWDRNSLIKWAKSRSEIAEETVY
ncbi:MAG: hypothetical protein KDH98_08960 [Calditrichaeota bacterium]|nr:hypothetical protein [Calditrichota bacterium]